MDYVLNFANLQTNYMGSKSYVHCDCATSEACKILEHIFFDLTHYFSLNI